MNRTTFFTVEVCGPTVPVALAAGNPELWALRERADTIKAGHRAGRWSPEALQRLASRNGVTLRGAYWMTYSARHGFHGAAQRPIC
jgi:hypothetical protein